MVSVKNKQEREKGLQPKEGELQNESKGDSTRYILS